MSNLHDFVQLKFPDKEFEFQTVIQSLWSGYGSIERWGNVRGASVIIKHIKFPNSTNHPRGWNSDIGHLRKVKSYEVERFWYDEYASKCSARIPQLILNESLEDAQVVVMEDLDASGFDLRIDDLNDDQLKSCISWLAQFHANFINDSGEGLWDIGTYWHLETRPEELKGMEDGELKQYSKSIDDKLNNATYKTLVHGDAKVANFCFSKEGEVAAVDFQYVGVGCGMKDLIYLMSSCLTGEECKAMENDILAFYFSEFHKFSNKENKSLEIEWRSLYKYAWADFNRFLKGWSPGHWKLSDYAESITENAVFEIKLKALLEVAKSAALKAGEFIEERVGSELTIRSKGSGLSLASSVVTEVDEKAQDIILNYILPTIKGYDLGILSEELKDDQSRFLKDYFWCIDPLDGTLPFTEGSEGYSVSIALVSKLGPPVLGVVYDPKNQNLYTAFINGGAFKNGEPIKVCSSDETFTFITDRSFTKTKEFEAFIGELKKEKALGRGFEVIAKGGASMNAIWVIENAPAAYIKPKKESLGGGGLWDFAASACIFRELGLRATNFEGGNLDLNRRDSIYMNHEGVWFEA